MNPSLKMNTHASQDLLIDLYHHQPDPPGNQPQGLRGTMQAQWFPTASQPRTKPDNIAASLDKSTEPPSNTLKGQLHPPPSSPPDVGKNPTVNLARPVEAPALAPPSSLDPAIELYPAFWAVAEKEAKYLEMNEDDLGHTGILQPKYVVDLINYKEGTICKHDRFWREFDPKEENNPPLCMKCKDFKHSSYFECWLCKTKCCQPCWNAVMKGVKGQRR
ncbi:hypothetical protein H072_7506 [Dactylellina haptotyla CBS 200.50]|uniref:Uncharacterized protein n=1 Tax=Dactylellina haptotyla (strain CBS 200.50) TaxID=1284197 RepID=S8BTW2_DACHA|nr:hypothetical protein H072_7506 [Dactylellina haptotyla CBS 200.50]